VFINQYTVIREGVSHSNDDDSKRTRDFCYKALPEGVYCERQAATETGATTTAAYSLAILGPS